MILDALGLRCLDIQVELLSRLLNKNQVERFGLEIQILAALASRLYLVIS